MKLGKNLIKNQKPYILEYLLNQKAKSNFLKVVWLWGRKS